jgi:hypothetical protein
MCLLFIPVQRRLGDRAAESRTKIKKCISSGLILPYTCPHTTVHVFIFCLLYRRRLGDCAEELSNLLVQEKLAGASLLVLANKQVSTVNRALKHVKTAD